MLCVGHVALSPNFIQSDLDFFVVVRPGSKRRFIDRLDWLEDVCPIAYHFQNCEIGHKLLFEDGLYGEYAVFEPGELKDALYTGGRLVWKHPSFAEEGITAGTAPIPPNRVSSVDHVYSEAVTNLYVGLGRYLRGEKLSAFKFIQGYPIDGLLSAMHLLETETEYYPDKFGNERRLERRFPRFAQMLPNLLQGYDRTPEAALQLLAYLESIRPVHPIMRREIRALAERCIAERDRAQTRRRAPPKKENRAHAAPG